MCSFKASSFPADDSWLWRLKWQLSPLDLPCSLFLEKGTLYMHLIATTGRRHIKGQSDQSRRSRMSCIWKTKRRPHKAQRRPTPSRKESHSAVCDQWFVNNLPSEVTQGKLSVSGLRYPIVRPNASLTGWCCRLLVRRWNLFKLEGKSRRWQREETEMRNVEEELRGGQKAMGKNLKPGGKRRI